MKKLLLIALLIPITVFANNSDDYFNENNDEVMWADNWNKNDDEWIKEEFAWADSDGEITTPDAVQKKHGGYVVQDKDGNKFWLDNIDNPKCAFFFNLIKNYSDSGFLGDINLKNYIESFDISECNND